MEKLYIGIFGAVNSGKSTLLNKLVGQQVALVSAQKGTTTDFVKKSFELTGLGACVLLDTAGLDDNTILGKAREEKTFSAIDLIDIAIVVINKGTTSLAIENLIKTLRAKNKQILIVNNKSDLKTFKPYKSKGLQVIPFSAKKDDADIILSALKNLANNKTETPVLLDDIINKNSIILLIMPQDSEAPKNRLILPQVQTIRNILDNHALAVCVQTNQIETALKSGIKFDLAITDSQVFKEVSKIIPQNIPLTSFSILFSRLKNDFEASIKATEKIKTLKDGDKILILESCTHTTPNCEDIGRVKLPNIIKKYTGKNLQFNLISGLNALPDDLSTYSLVIQCGGCVLTRTQILARSEKARVLGVAVTNYGMALAYCQGILGRVVAPLLKNNL